MESNVHVRYFAGYREIVGRDAETVEIETPTQLDKFLDQLREKHPELEGELAGGAVAVNLEVSEPEATTISPGDEVALLPPVGGG